MPEDRLTTLIAGVLQIGVDQVHDDSGLNETENWDSLRNMMIMMEVEAQFGLKLDFDSYIDVGTVASIRAPVAAHQAYAAG